MTAGTKKKRARRRQYVLTAAFEADLHPRGHDGKFIEKLGFIKIVGGLDKGNHGQVVDITPDKDNPGKPIIHYRQVDSKGNQIGPRLGVSPDQVEAVDEKARLTPVDMGERRTNLDVDFNEAGAPDEFADAPLNLDTQSGIDLLRQRVHGEGGGGGGGGDAVAKARATYQQRRRELRGQAETAYLSGLVADQQDYLDQLRRLDRAYIASRAAA